MSGRKKKLSDQLLFAIVKRHKQVFYDEQGNFVMPSKKEIYRAISDDTEGKMSGDAIRMAISRRQIQLQEYFER